LTFSEKLFKLKSHLS